MSREIVTIAPACLWFFPKVLKQTSHALALLIAMAESEHTEQLYILSPGLGIRKQWRHFKSSNLTLSILPNDFLSWFRKKRQKYNLRLNSNMAAALRTPESKSKIVDQLPLRMLSLCCITEKYQQKTARFLNRMWVLLMWIRYTWFFSRALFREKANDICILLK